MKNNDLDISFFYFSCEKDQEELLLSHLLSFTHIQDSYFPHCFTFSHNHISIPQFLQTFSSNPLYKDVEFTHVYALTLADTTGYSYIKNGSIVYQHIESLSDRLSHIKIQQVEHKEKSIVIHFNYYYYENLLDFDSKALVRKISGVIEDSFFYEIENYSGDFFEEKIKQFLDLQGIDCTIDSLIEDKCYSLIKLSELQTHLFYRSLENQLNTKFDKVQIKKI